MRSGKPANGGGMVSRKRNLPDQVQHLSEQGQRVPVHQHNQEGQRQEHHGEFLVEFLDVGFGR